MQASVGSSSLSNVEVEWSTQSPLCRCGQANFPCDSQYFDRYLYNLTSLRSCLLEVLWRAVRLHCQWWKHSSRWLHIWMSVSITQRTFVSLWQVRASQTHRRRHHARVTLASRAPTAQRVWTQRIILFELWNHFLITILVLLKRRHVKEM
jgi:hypothetical protein